MILMLNKNHYLLESLILFQLLSYAPLMMVMVTLLKRLSGNTLKRKFNVRRLLFYIKRLILTKTSFEVLSSSIGSPMLPCCW